MKDLAFFEKPGDADAARQRVVEEAEEARLRKEAEEKRKEAAERAQMAAEEAAQRAREELLNRRLLMNAPVWSNTAEELKRRADQGVTSCVKDRCETQDSNLWELVRRSSDYQR